MEGDTEGMADVDEAAVEGGEAVTQERPTGGKWKGRLWEWTRKGAGARRQQVVHIAARREVWREGRRGTWGDE